MINYIIRRLLIAIPVIFLIVLATFVMIHATPGGPFDTVGERSMPPHIRQILERRYGLDRPLWEQFFLYMQNLLKGDLGPLFRNQSQDVNDIVAQSFPVSFQLGSIAVLLGFAIGVPAGIIAALKHNSLVDYTATFVAVLSASVPSLVLGPLLILIFYVNLNWFPAINWGAEPPFFLGIFPQPRDLLSSEFLKHAVLPGFALGTAYAAGIARLTRAGLLDVLSADYIRTARAKGLRESAVIIVHALKNSMIPVATLLGPLIAGAVTGSLIVEQIFALNGMGRWFIASVQQREYFLLTGLTLIYGVLLVAGNLFVDVLYAWLDPRIRYD
ncbi:MAG: ABC transporter permease [Chloroflexi bacterium]|nr:ABC transporter permease [Chloroflexota bacterium]MCI0648789.1 ABC transporter permease [Chloroflexota bacterium]MCI0727257.1 ABC transporter permease [Chloroflexota bacterium]